MQVLFVVTTFALFISSVNAECANACNGHGRCTSYDMCVCNRNVSPTSLLLHRNLLFFLGGLNVVAS